ncbi:T9SS type B sorting domain-containing protein [Flavobacterium rhizosphaerae]|uniref:Gliding motility-associated C-terminal domain-containing protein n=1 Tax=Flavobacterium rhizosphaerae TaxID=3163298 RepID=A0ABW8YRR4_9FLAO
MKRKTTLRYVLLLSFLFIINTISHAQVYMHDFGTSSITTHPYTDTPSVLDAALSNSSWTNSNNAWTSFSGASGEAIALSNSGGTPTITFNFQVAPGKQLDINSFNFWRRRSNTGAQNWSMTINGIMVGSGDIKTTGEEIGLTPVANAVTGLTGTVTVKLNLSGATGSGTFRLDDFTLNGIVTSTCASTVVSSFFPLSGPAHTLITINGSGFQTGSGTTSVLFNGVASPGFTVISNNQIKAIVPENATSGTVTVVSNGCSGNSSTPFNLIISNCGSAVSPTELFISEVYDDEAGEGGAIELYNATGAPINLSQYSIARSASIGGGNTYDIALSGTLAPNAVYIARTSTPVCGLSGTPSATLTTGFNDSDELQLKKNGTVIDRVYTPSNLGFTMIRNANASVPAAAYNSADWTISNTEECTNLGIHSITTDNNSYVATQPASEAICEGGGAQFAVAISDQVDYTYQWKMLNSSGNWSNITDNGNFSGTNTATLTITDAPLSLNSAQFYCEINSPGCVLVTNAAQLTVSPLPLAIVIPTQPTCLVTTGSLIIVPAVGQGLTYSLDGTNFQSEPIFSSLVPGSYTLTIKTSAGCFTTVPVTINEAPEIPSTANISITQPTCATATGSITINSPLNVDFTYSINGVDYQSSPVFSNLNPGTYQVTVMSLLGCVSTAATVTINQVPPPPATPEVTVTQPTCSEPTGTITVTAPINGAYSYSIDGVNFQMGTTFAGLAEGNYTITVKNVEECTSVSGNIIINAAPAPPAVATTTVTQPTCDTPTGTIEITAPIGSEYTYSIDGTNFQTGTTFTGLAEGDYTITVQNAEGCTSVTGTITIDTAPVLPDTAITTVTQPTCIIPTGTIIITSPIGLGYTYSIDGTNFQTEPIFAGLGQGSYTVTVQNADGCTSQTTVTINTIPTITVATTIVTQPTCITPTGTIEITAPLELGYTYSIDGINFQTGTTFAGLAEGSYTITVQNADGCTSVTGTITINAVPAPPAVATTTVMQPTCATPTGTIEITAPTGTGYTYSIDGTNFQTGTTFTGLAEGDYTITTQNADGCTSVTGTVTIDAAPAPPVAATTTVTQPTCTTPTGTIEITAPTGTGYTYSINGTDFQSETTFADLGQGSYTVTVQNADGCTSQTTVTINTAPTVAVATTTVTQPTCTTPTGTIEITAPTGTGYTYSINGTDFQTGTTFANLTEGTYTLTVQNTEGCTSVSGNIAINAVAPVAVATTTVTQPTCATPTGTIEVTAPTGTGYTYSIDGTNFQTGTTFSGLAEGNYTITTQNADGCTSVTGTVTIDAAPAPPVAATTTVTQPTCTTPTGTIEITAPTGTGYTYSINGTDFQSETTFADLGQGGYTVTVQNADGCTSQTTVTINTAPTAAVATTTVTQPTCTTPTGTIEITAPTGTGYTYSINGTDFQTGTTFADLTEGTYTITVQNTDGCTSVTGTITINAVPAPPAVATTTVTQPTCATPTGTIEVTAPTGTGYTYSIDGTNFQTETTFSNLAPGTYTVTVMSTSGCTSETAEITINTADDAPDTPTVTVTQPNCTTMSWGNIQVTAPTGTGITYSIDGTNFQSNSLFAGLTPGDYTVTVKNANGCTSTSGIITINPIPTAPIMAVATLTQPTCTVQTGTITITAPVGTEYTYSIDGVNYQSSPIFSGLAPGATYVITTKNEAGCTTDSQPYTIDPSPAPAIAATDVTQPTCSTATGTIVVTSPTGSGFTYSLDDGPEQNGTMFINVTPGPHTITVTNLNGCTSVTPAIIINPAPETPEVAKFNLTQPTCATGTGSIIITSPLGDEYSYSINNGASYQDETEFNNVAPGTYIVTVIGAGGCTSESASFTLAEPTGDITLTGTEGCREVGTGNGYILEISASGSSFDAATATYSWTDQFGNTLEGDTMFNVTQYMRDYNITASDFPVDFTATVTTSGGCTGTYTFSVDSGFCDIPRGISPNNDGMNDNFDISYMNAKKLSIFNRYGEQVYTKANYKNEWYGQSDKGELPTGTYFYVIEFDNESKTGWVYINREIN